MRLQERRSLTVSSSRSRVAVRPAFKRRISDSVATRTRARVLARHAFSCTAPAAEIEGVQDTSVTDGKGERRTVITASALTMCPLYFVIC